MNSTTKRPPITGIDVYKEEKGLWHIIAHFDDDSFKEFRMDYADLQFLRNLTEAMENAIKNGGRTSVYHDKRWAQDWD